MTLEVKLIVQSIREYAHLGFVNPVQVFVKLTKVVVVKGYVRALAFNQDDRQSGLSINDHRVDL